MTRVKICGLTRVQDVKMAAAYGADALGLVFYQPSPRAVTIEQAQVLAAAVPPFVTLVGLFVDAQPDYVNEVLRQVPLDLLQFHGDEEDRYCQSFDKPYLKAIRVKAQTDLVQCAANYRCARGLLLDAHVPGVPGGTGVSFDWSLIPAPSQRSLPVILSGGLTAENAAQGIHRVHPWAVDVSSGVEQSKGIKDEARTARFMQEIKQANV